ncbi:hypothetical protein C6502_15530 [Candidatus Poribacteria bacterium]|nr:MAG: hypothetical protein C6502_15530 [Candidatus Poribacteria bacterium]
MEEKDKKQDAMPPSNATPEEIGEFWDTHSLADYWDETNEVDFQVNLKSKHNLIPVEPEIAEQIQAQAAKQGVSPEKLVNFWLREKLKGIATNQ